MKNLNFSNIFEENKIDIILHMASQTNKKCADIDFINSNIKSPTYLVYYAIKHKVKYFINMDTTFYHNEINGYTLSKRQFKQWLKLKEKNINIINLKIDNIYGEEDNEIRFIPTVINSLLNDKKELRLTDGLQKRDFIYIDDCIKLFCKVIQNINHFNDGFYEYGVGSGKSVSIKDLVLLIQKNINKSQTILKFGAIEYRTKKESELNSKIDISQTLKDFDWHPSTSLENGLEKVIKYYEKLQR